MPGTGTACVSKEVSRRDEGTSTPCLYCGNRRSQPLFENIADRLGYVPGRWAYQRCGECGSAMLTPLPRADELPGFYPPVYSFTTDLQGTSRLQRLAAQLEYRLFYHPQYDAQATSVLRGIRWDGRPGQRLLDIGCGRGLRLRAFQRRGFAIQGMDFQPEITRYVEQTLHIPTVCTDIAGLAHALPHESFDVITAFYVMEHVVDVQELLRSAWQLLRPGGWLVAAIPLVDSVQATLFRGAWSQVCEAPRHTTFPSRRGARVACERARFTEVSLRPDVLLSCTSMLALSVCPGATANRVYAGGRLLGFLGRVAAAWLSLAALPWCWFENHVGKRPAGGLLFARRPAEGVNKVR